MQRENAEFKPPTREECEGHLRRVRPQLRLGKYICAGGTGLVFELQGTPTPSVVKIVDSRYMARTSGCTAEDKQLRKIMQKYIEQEIRLMRLLKSPYVMQLDDVARIQNPDGVATDDYAPVTLIFMPKMISLMEFTARVRKLTADEIVQMGLDIGEALAICQRNRVIHRDLKPSNIFVREENGRLRFVLGDFGIGRRVEKLGEEIVTNIGTGYFCAPEIMCREVLYYYNSDIYSLGMTMFYLLAGTHALMKKDPVTGITTVIKCERIPPKLQDFLQKSLQLEPRHRFHTPEEMISALKAVGTVKWQDVDGKPPCIMAAKEALCHGKEDAALKYAVESYNKQEPGCRRMLAYCIYRKAPRDERVMALLQICFMEGDAMGILIRGMLRAEQGDLLRAGKDIRDAALSGQQCVPAWYYYGRFLYYGDFEGIKQDRKQGIMLIQRAAEQHFYPALRILKRIRKECPELEIPADLAQLLEKEYSRDNPLESRDIIRFL